LFDGNTMPRIFSVWYSLHPYVYYLNDFEIGSSILMKPVAAVSCASD